MDLRKRKDEAAQAFAKGKLARAAKLYGMLAAENPGDPQLLVRLGEVERRRGGLAKATAAFVAAGRRFTRDSMLLRAIAAYKLVLEIEPEHPEAIALLAELHARRLGRPPPVQAPPQPAPSQGPVAGQMAAPPPAQPQATISSTPTPLPPAAKPLARIPVVRIAPEPQPQLRQEEEEQEPFDGLLFPLDVDLQDLDRPPHEALSQIPLFSELDPAAFRRLVEGSRHIQLAAGELAVRQGERGDSFFVVVRGGLDVIRQRLPGEAGESLRLARLEDGAFFGEMALLTGTARSASVLAVRESELLQFTSADLRRLVLEHPPAAAVLRRFYRQRLLANVLATAPLFRPFDPATKSRLIGNFRTREISAGETVVDEGSEVDGLFVILNGTFEVLRRSGPVETSVALLREGDLVGERSLLHGGTAGASCRARSRGMVLRLPREAFAAVLAEHPGMLETLEALDRKRQGSDDPDGGDLPPDGSSTQL